MIIFITYDYNIYVFLEYFAVVDKQQQIDHLLSYVINLVHKIQEHIDYIYH